MMRSNIRISDSNADRVIIVVIVVLIAILPNPLLSQSVALLLGIPLLIFVGYISTYSIKKTALLLIPAPVVSAVVRIILDRDWATKNYRGFGFDLFWILPFQLLMFWLVHAVFVFFGATLRKKINRTTHTKLD